MPIPKNKQWIGTKPGNYSGNLWATLNMDLEKAPGRIILSDKMRRYVSGLGVPYQFVKTNAAQNGTSVSGGQWFAIVHGTDILRNGNTTITAGTWVTDDTAGTFNDPHDMILHEFAGGEQRLLCSRNTDIAILNSSGTANAWDDDWFTAVASGPTLTNVGFHPMARLQRLVAVGDKQSDVPVIHTIDSSDTVVTSAISFGAEYTVRVAYASSDRFWFGLQHDSDGLARIIEWDGASATYNNEYDLDGAFPLAGWIVNDIPYFITEKGIIFRYTGGGFEPIADFNLKEDRMVFNTGITNQSTIQPHGAYVDGNIVYINVGIPMLTIASASTLNFGVRRARSGIWILNLDNFNLYHHMGIGQHATANTDIDYGHGHYNQPGAIIKATVGSDRKIIAGASVYTGGANWTSSTQSGFYRNIPNNEVTDNAGRNRGYFITPYVPIKDAEAMWEALWVKFKRFFADAGGSTTSNRIIVKWRTQDPLKEADAQDPDTNDLDLMNATGTWVNTTSFTSKVPKGVVVGNEVEILVGDNAGSTFNVSALSATPDNSSTITVTIDEATQFSSTDTFLCRFDNWNAETGISTLTSGNQRVPFTEIGHGEFIQLKVEFRGFEIELDEIEPIFKTKTAYSQA